MPISSVDLMNQTQPRLILANTVSEVIFQSPPQAYVMGAVAVAPRMIWSAHEGDILLTPIPVPDHVKAYACELLRLRPDTITCLTPASRNISCLAKDALADPDILARLHHLRASTRDLVLHPFVLDRAALVLARHLRLQISYAPWLDAGDARWEVILELVCRLNRKSQFRNLCIRLGLPVAPGVVVNQPSELLAHAEPLVTSHGAIIIKRDRGSNSFENAVITDSDGDWRGRLERLAKSMPCAPRVVEAFYPGRWYPIIEYDVAESGPEIRYRCEEAYADQTWMGMRIPWDLPRDLATAFLEAGERVGVALHAQGYRGPFSVEGIGTADGRWILTELNLRMSGGTHLADLLTHLVGPSDLSQHTASGGNLAVAVCPPFEELRRRTEKTGLAATTDQPEGVIYTADGTKTDGKIRYVLIARDEIRAEQIMIHLRETLAREFTTEVTRSCSYRNFGQRQKRKTDGDASGGVVWQASADASKTPEYVQANKTKGGEVHGGEHKHTHYRAR